jgi:hypothetical protein
MSDHNLFNQFISAHNLSLTEGVFCFKLGGSRSSSYDIVWDTRTHPLSLFTNSTKPEITHGGTSEAKNKLFGNLRDKFNEVDRPFALRLYHNMESYRILRCVGHAEVLQQRLPDGEERGVVRVTDNIPVYSEFPLWSFLGQPVLSLIIRVRSVFTFFSCRDEFKELLLGLVPTLSDELARVDLLKYVEDKEGQGPLQSLSFRRAHTITVSDVSPKATTEIKFEPFEIADPRAATILTDVAFLNSLDEFRIQPDYALVRRTDAESSIPLGHAGYRLCSWVDAKGTLFEFCFLQEQYGIKGRLSGQGVITVQAGERRQRVLEFDRNMLPSATFLLYSRVFSCKFVTNDPSWIDYRMEGTFVPPEKKLTSSIPFRDPMSCTSAEIETLKSSDYPMIAQYKLDGNRIIVYLLDEGASIKYYTRNGILQSAKFGQQFDKAVKEFYQRVTSCQRINPNQRSGAASSREDRRIRNIMLDCECYRHDVVHSDIGGWCNRIETSENFRKLKLYLLSWLDLDTLKEIEERKRQYVVSPLIFEQMLGDIAPLIDPESNLLLNSSYLVETREDLFDLMSASVEEGYEGLVVYPMRKPYTFANAGLKKIKKFFDGECQVISYKESETEPGVIGSVLVRAKASFSKSPTTPYVTFFVNAALKQELKPSSMHCAHFQNCIGKEYTIICGSFSDTGVPIHARFKGAFGLESERLDHA